MEEAVKIAIADKVKLKAIRCYEEHKTATIDCENQYVEFYKHALDYFGCEVTRNTQDLYLDFIVYDPEKLNNSVEYCVSTWVEKKPGDRGKTNAPISWFIVLAFVFGFFVGRVV